MDSAIFLPCSVASVGVHRQLSCCSEMWRLLLRDRETSVPGPRGKKKKKERKREQEGKREREAGGKLIWRHQPPAASAPPSFGEKAPEFVNFFKPPASLGCPLSKERGAAGVPSAGNPGGCRPRILEPARRRRRGREQPGRQSILLKPRAGRPG